MNNNLKQFKDLLQHNKYDLAFVVGNGINRHAYENERDVSWERMLLDIWQQFSFHTKSFISEGISTTEFYNIIEMEAGSIDDVRLKVVDYFDNWESTSYHKKFQTWMEKWDVPLLTTNFDRSIDDGYRLFRMKHDKKNFTDFYPWNVYFSNKELLNPLEGFGVWHINGMIGYRRSVRLSLSEYINQTSRARDFLHSNDNLAEFDLKNKPHWNGDNTWLHIFLNRSLCIFGLALDENEIFLRWLLLERERYFRKFRERKKKGWYVCLDNEVNKGKNFFLDYCGFDIITLNDYNEIYEEMLKI